MAVSGPLLLLFFRFRFFSGLLLAAGAPPEESEIMELIDMPLSNPRTVGPGVLKPLFGVCDDPTVLVLQLLGVAGGSKPAAIAAFLSNAPTIVFVVCGGCRFLG